MKARILTKKNVLMHRDMEKYKGNLKIKNKTIYSCTMLLDVYIIASKKLSFILELSFKLL